MGYSKPCPQGHQRILGVTSRLPPSIYADVFVLYSMPDDVITLALLEGTEHIPGRRKQECQMRPLFGTSNQLSGTTKKMLRATTPKSYNGGRKCT